MRLTKIKIQHFGQLANLTFTLPSAAINVFFGPNEAGKSTTVAFIEQVLFGFYLRSESSPFFADYQPLAHVSPMGGSLFFQDDDGHEFELERLWAKGDKSKRGSLTVKKDGQVVPANLFFTQIKDIDGRFYTDSFIFNQEMLAQIASLSQEELLEQIYYLGAANSSQLLHLRDNFAKAARQLFKKTGRKPPVNVLLKEIKRKREAVQSSEQQFGTYRQIELDLQKQEEQLTKQEEQLTTLQKRANQLADLKKQLATYQNWQALKRQRHALKFNRANYQKAQLLTAQIDNLQAQNQAASEQLQLGGQNEAQDLTQARHLLTKRTDLLAWQHDYQEDQQKGQQIEAQAKQILASEPALGQIKDFSASRVAALRQDYQKLPKQEAAAAFTQPSLYLSVSGAFLIILGFVALRPLGWPSVFLLLAGLGLLVFAYQQKRTAARRQITRAKKVSSFQQKYGLNPLNLNLQDLLQELGRYRLVEQEATDNQTNLTALQEKLTELSKELAVQLKRPVEAKFSALFAGLDLLEQTVTQAQTALERQQTLRSQLQQNRLRLEKLRLQRQQVLAVDQVKQMSEYDQRYRDFLQQTKLETQMQALKSSLGTNLEQLDKLQQDPQQLDARMQKVQAEFRQEQVLIRQQRDQIAQKKVQLKQLADSEAVLAQKQALANTTTQLQKASEDYLADLLAAKWLNRTLDIASNERFPKMMTAAREYLRLLTGGRYVDLQLGKRITVTRRDGQKRTVAYLSRGTAEQLYFALKLAFVAQIRDQINLPILIDDSFVNFDDRRLVYIEQLLQQISRSNQVLIFTAQKALASSLPGKSLVFGKEKQNA